jgi:Uma2 family endonuclease
MAISVSRWHFTVDDYERMAEAGILREDDRVELLEGDIIEMAPIGPPHAGCVKRLNLLLVSRRQTRAVVSVQDPIRLDNRSEPQPDLALLEPRSDFYSTRHAGPDDVLLVVEVSSSSVPFDRLVKMPMYARAGVRQAWLVDLDGGGVEVYRLTAEGSYGEPELVRGPGMVVIDSFPDVSVTAAEILGT